MNNFFELCDDEMPTTDSNPTMPLIGDSAPEFDANTTAGPLHFPGDYAGKWVVLFSHPSDFTPVCTTEFMAFQSMIADFNELNTALVGLSVGGIASHLAWIDAIGKIKFGNWENMQITFPVIDDTTMRVAKMYGMIHPNASDTHAVRAVFIIDPAGIIRAILYYPASTGRNFAEIMRILVALQTTDAFKVSTPADWMPGDDVIVPSPATTNTMRQVIEHGAPRTDVHAWFLSSRRLSDDEIWTRLTAKAPTKNKKKK